VEKTPSDRDQDGGVKKPAGAFEFSPGNAGIGEDRGREKGRKEGRYLWGGKGLLRARRRCRLSWAERGGGNKAQITGDVDAPEEPRRSSRALFLPGLGLYNARRKKTDREKTPGGMAGCEIIAAERTRPIQKKLGGEV